MNAFGISDVGKVRTNNEDSLFFSDAPVSFLPNLYIVADGLGGHKSGEVASAGAVRFFLEYCEKNPQTSDVAGFLSDGVLYANKKIFEMSLTNPKYEGMGTTFSVCVNGGENLYIAHIGDTRVYGFAGGALTQYTTDHTFANEMIKFGELTREQARTHRCRHMLTRALGLWHNAEIERIIKTPDAQKIILCSDGLTNMLSDGEISEIITRSENDNAAAAAALLGAALEAGGNDNTTLIIFDIE